MANNVDELLVFQNPQVAERALSATLSRPSRSKDYDLCRQLSRAAVGVVSNIAEGFEQKTDRHFARYLYDARGGTREIRAQLDIATARNWLSSTDARELAVRYEELAKMLTGLIRHLEWEDRKQRR